MQDQKLTTTKNAECTIHLYQDIHQNKYTQVGPTFVNHGLPKAYSTWPQTSMSVRYEATNSGAKRQQLTCPAIAPMKAN